MPSLGFLLADTGNPPKFTPDTINKSLKASEVFPEESFKVRLRDESGAFMATFVLGLFNDNRAMKK